MHLTIARSFPAVFLIFLSYILIYYCKSMSSSLPKVHGIHEIIDRYDHFIIDQWGVLHNGKIPYDGVIESLEAMKAQRKSMILLSNSSRRKTDSFRGLQKVGIDPTLFDDIVTSGDFGWQLLKDRKFDFSLPRILSSNERLKVFVIGNGEEDYEYLESANCEFATPAEADIILARGTFAAYIQGYNNPLTYSISDDLIAAASDIFTVSAPRQTPLLVTNPDTMRPGTNSPMPGQLATFYHDMTDGAAPIQFVGKPHSLVYETCASILTDKTHKTWDELRNRVCCIGDSLEHDVLGARDFGLDSLWIVNGVHSAAMKTEESQISFPEDRHMKELIDLYNTQPTWAIPTFRFYKH